MTILNFKKNKNVLNIGISFFVFVVVVELAMVLFYPFISDSEYSRQNIKKKLRESDEYNIHQNDTVQKLIKDSLTKKDYKKIILHPFLGFIQAPEEKHAFYDDDVNYETEIYGKINEFGFDGPSNIPQKSPEKVIIALLGGSFSMFFYHEAKDKLVEELKKSPLFSNKKIEVYCYASSGYKEPQQLMALNYFLTLGGQYDIVINIDGINDIALPVTDNIQYNLFPYFPRFWYVFSNRVSSAESNILFAEIVNSRNKKSKYKSVFNTFPFNILNSTLIFWEILDRNLDMKIKTGFNLYVKSVYESIDKKNIENFGPHFDYSLPRNKQFEQLSKYWKQCSKMINALSRNMEFEYFHFLQPNQHVSNSKVFSAEEKMFTFMRSDNPWNFSNIANNGYPFLIQSGKELIQEGVNFEDLTMIYKTNKETIYRDPCCHVNRKGNYIVAEEIAKFIVQKMKN